jgi:hypothetical protein
MNIAKLLLLSLGFLVSALAAENGYNQQKKELSQTKKFPKILWAYWDSGLSQAPLSTKLCYQNMAHFANQSGW